MKSFWHELPRPFFVLAPMEAVTDVVFRQVVARAGAPDVFYTEFANATGWVHAGDRAIAGRLIKTDDERPIVAQIWGGEPGDMEQFAHHCASLGYDGIDINMGCPAKSAVKSGGSALIRKPEVAIAAIAAATSAGLPVSVKTRLGYTYVDEWRDWLTTLLQQDIAVLTIHLRTKREMSKVPAHHELIPEIKALRDQIAPDTLLVINGDIRDRQHGIELYEQYDIDGVMIGRGIFQNPFAFVDDMSDADTSDLHSETISEPTASAVANGSSGTTRTVVEGRDRKRKLVDLLSYHLDLFDQYQPQTGRPYETLKRFYKIYIRDFDGASDVRDQLMHTTSTDEARTIIAKI